MPGHISFFFDTVSPYSYYAACYILPLRSLLLSHKITLSLHPVFLGAIQVKTGNIPPFKIPAKAAYNPHDLSKAAKHFGLPPFPGSPPFFPMRSLAAQRVLIVVQEEFDSEVFEKVLLGLFEAVWRDWMDLGDVDVLGKVMKGLFRDLDVENTKADVVMRNIQDPAVKEKLNAQTTLALDLGAFGAPFFSVKKWNDEDSNVQEPGEPFFGSDRFEYMFEYLDLPLQKMRILEKSEVDSRSKL